MKQDHFIAHIISAALIQKAPFCEAAVAESAVCLFLQIDIRELTASFIGIL